MKIHRWNKDSEGLSDRENIGLSILIKGWKLNIQHHSTLSKNQPEDLWDSKRISNIRIFSYKKS